MVVRVSVYMFEVCVIVSINVNICECVSVHVRVCVRACVREGLCDMQDGKCHRVSHTHRHIHLYLKPV